MGAFDDLIPTAPASRGLFDDLIPGQTLTAERFQEYQRTNPPIQPRTPFGEVTGDPDREFTRALYHDLPADVGGAMHKVGSGIYEGGVAALQHNIEDLAGLPADTAEQPGLTTEQAIRTYPKPVQAGIKGVQGLVESTPQLAIATVSPLAGALAFGLTPEGFDPKQAAIAAALPVIGKWSGAIVETMAAKAGVTTSQALLAWNKLGGASGAAGAIGADQAIAISQLPPEQREQAWIDAAGNIGSMFILGTLSEHKRPNVEKIVAQNRYAETPGIGKTTLFKNEAKPTEPAKPAGESNPINVEAKVEPRGAFDDLIPEKISQSQPPESSRNSELGLHTGTTPPAAVAATSPGAGASGVPNLVQRAVTAAQESGTVQGIEQARVETEQRAAQQAAGKPYTKEQALADLPTVMADMRAQLANLEATIKGNQLKPAENNNLPQNQGNSPEIAPPADLESNKPETTLKVGDRIAATERDEEGFASDVQPAVSKQLDSLPVGSQVVHKFTGNVFEKHKSGEWRHRPDIQRAGNAIQDAGTATHAGLARAEIIQVGPTSTPAQKTPQVAKPVTAESPSFTAGQTVAVRLSNRSTKEHLGKIIQLQPDGSATVQLHGEKTYRTLRKDQFQLSKTDAARAAKAEEIASVPAEQQAKVKADAAEFAQIVEDYAPLLEWAPAEAYDRNTVMQEQGIQNARLRAKAIDRAMRAVLPEGQGNSLIDRARALPRLVEYLQQQFPGDNSIAKRRALEEFGRSEPEAPTPAEQRTAAKQDAAHLRRIAAQNPGVPELRNLVVHSTAGRVASAGSTGQLGGNPGRKSRITAAEQKALRELDRIFGTRTIIVDSPGDSLPFNGWKDRKSNVILIHARTQNPILVVAGHELWHHIEKTHPGLADKVKAALAPLIQNHEHFMARLRARGQGRADAKSELIGDFVGDNFGRQEFWEDLKRREPNLFKRLARIVKAWLDKLIAKLKGEQPKSFASEQYFTDLEHARHVVGTALVEAARETQYRRAGVPVDVTTETPSAQAGGEFSKMETAAAKRDKIVADAEKAFDALAAKNKAVVDYQPKDPSDEYSLDSWSVYSSERGNDNVATIYKDEDGNYEVSDKHGNTLGWRQDSKDFDRALSDAKDYVESGETQEQYNLNADIRSEILQTIELPPDFRLKDIQDTKWGSVYYLLEKKIGQDEDGEWETENYKVSIRNHEPSPFREKEFGANDAYYEVPKEATPKDLADAVSKVERFAWRRSENALESGASGSTSRLDGQPNDANQSSSLTNSQRDKAVVGKESRMVKSGDTTPQPDDSNKSGSLRSGHDMSDGRKFSKPEGNDLFGAPESVEEQRARLKAEAETQKLKKAKDAMQDRAGARLTAADIDTTQEMFGGADARSTRQDKAGQGSLFSKPEKQFPERFALAKPIKGPTGASIVGYEWRSTMGEKYSAREGGMVDARVSDWDNADESTGTGRAIVHVFYVEHPNGTVHPEGIRSAQTVLGINESRLMTIAKKERAAQQYRQDQERAEMANYEKAAVTTAQEAARNYRKWNYSPMRTFEENDEIFNESALFEKAGKFIRRSWKAATRMQAGGWTLVKDDPARTVGTTKAIDAIRAPESEGQVGGGLEQGSLFSKPENYVGWHTAPQADSGAPAWNLKNIYPDDVYGPNGARYYGHYGDYRDAAAMAVIRDLKDHPARRVMIYRAIPADIKGATINPGDWVTTVRDYAAEHGKSQFDKYRILSKTVKARDIFTNGDSIFEWGYDPQKEQTYAEEHFSQNAMRKAAGQEPLYSKPEGEPPPGNDWQQLKQELQAAEAQMLEAIRNAGNPARSISKAEAEQAKALATARVRELQERLASHPDRYSNLSLNELDAKAAEVTDRLREIQNTPSDPGNLLAGELRGERYQLLKDARAIKREKLTRPEYVAQVLKRSEALTKELRAAKAAGDTTAARHAVEDLIALQDGELGHMNPQLIESVRKDLVARGELEALTPASNRTLGDLTAWLKANKIESPRLSLKDRVNLGKRLADEFAAGKTKLEHATARARSVWQAFKAQWRAPKTDDEPRAIFKEWHYEKQFSGLETHQWIQRIRADIPQKVRRMAISVWLDADGDKGLLTFQRDAVPARYQAVWDAALKLTPTEQAFARQIKQDFESKLADGQLMGLIGKGRENYGVPQIWAKAPEHGANYRPDATGPRTARNPLAKLDPRDPFFALERTHESYFDGIMANGVPKSLDIADLVGVYNVDFHGALADRSVIKALKDAKLPDGSPAVMVSGGAKIEMLPNGARTQFVDSNWRPKDAVTQDGRPYQTIDHWALRGWTFAAKDTAGNPIMVKGDFLVHPDLYRALKTQLEGKSALRDPDGPLGDIAHLTKFMLESGAFLKASKFAAATFHGATLAEHMMTHAFSGMPSKERLTLLNPFVFGVEVDPAKNLELANLMRHGMDLGFGGARMLFEEGLSSHGGILSKVPGLGDGLAWLSNGLFQEYLPRLKVRMGSVVLHANLKRYSKPSLSGPALTEQQIYELTASQVNAAFGGQNWKLMGRSRTFLDVNRLLFTAPDFLLSRAKVVGQAGKPYNAEQRYFLIAQAALVYALARILNYLLDDDPHWEAENALRVIHKNRAYSARFIVNDIGHLLQDPAGFAGGRLGPWPKALYESITGRDMRSGARIDVPIQTDNGALRATQILLKDLAMWGLPIGTEGFLPGATGREQTTLGQFGVGLLGVGSQRFTPETEMYRAAAEFNRKSTDPKTLLHQQTRDEAVKETSVYRKLDVLLEAEDYAAARKEYQSLLADGRTADGIKNRYKAMSKDHLARPFSGSQEREKQFKASLTPEQLREYQRAIELRKQREQAFQKMLKAPR